MNINRLILIFSFFITLTLSSSLYAQKTIQISDIELINLGDGQLFAQDRGTEKKPVEGKVRIITGFTTEYIDAGFASGIAIGKWDYYKDNKLSSTTNYDNGYENGEKITYYGDGKTINTKANLINGKVDGIAVSYNSEGQKEYEKSMKSGVDDGPERTFDKNGEIKSETIFKEGKAEGKSFSVLNQDSNDCYKVAQFYKNGMLDGEYKEVYCDGEPKINGKYITGNKDGVWEYFKKDGSKKKPTEEYKEGDLIKKISYFTNGNVDTEQNFKKGKQDGVIKQYTQDGKLKSEKNYVNGKPVGKQTQYFTSTANDYIETSNYSENNKKNGEYLEIFSENQKVKTKGQYVDDLKEGKWILSNIDASVVKEIDYSKGKLVGTKKTEKSEGSYNISPYTTVTFLDENDNRVGNYIETFDTTKKPKTKGQFVKGRYDGKWLYYDEKGNIKKEEIYENGIMKY